LFAIPVSTRTLFDAQGRKARPERKKKTRIILRNNPKKTQKTKAHKNNKKNKNKQNTNKQKGKGYEHPQRSDAAPLPRKRTNKKNRKTKKQKTKNFKLYFLHFHFLIPEGVF
jgi:hypothetical protein